MLVRMTFKTPDADYHALRSVPKEKHDEVTAIIEKFVECGEYVDIELDTEKGTATVVPVR